MNILQSAKNYKDYAIKTRRYLHSIPEEGFKEFKTTEKICKELDEMGISYKRCSKTGVIADIKGKNGGKTIALRADIDALTVFEENDLEYKSTHEGYMHACGHDAHTAMLLTAAKILKENENELNGNVRLVFQPAEEGSKEGQGAPYMIREGALDGVDEIFGMHVWPAFQCGEICASPGPSFAGTYEFEITVKGKSGHGAMPNTTVDAVVVASAIVMNLQSVVSRETNPFETAVLSVGTISGGTRWNVISGEVKMTGTVRCFDKKRGEEIIESLVRIAEMTASSYRACAEVKHQLNIGPTINHESSALRAQATLKNLFGDSVALKHDITMGGEDFSDYIERIPGVFCLLGVGNKEKGIDVSVHNSKFNLDEDALEIGAAFSVAYAVDYLNGK